jgi:hypothetical protein
LVLEPYFIHLAAERISAALSLFKNWISSDCQGLLCVDVR